MKYLFLLISIYTITSKQAEPSGDVPANATCSYTQTASRSGQMTAGNTIDLVLSGYDGAELKSMTLMMKSNTSAGAGALSVKVAGQEVWSIADAAFNNSAWHGAYSTEFVPITHTWQNMTVPDGADIAIHLSASANSLYLESVELQYIAPQAQPHTVSFKTYTSQNLSPLTESQAGAGVVLPDVAIVDAVWQFSGWAATPVSSSAVQPLVYPAGDMFYPAADCTLHAVYMAPGETPEWLPATDIVSGDYLMTLYVPDIGKVLRAYGAVNNGVIATTDCTVVTAEGEVMLPNTSYSPNEVYTLKKADDGTITIKHTATGKFVTLGKNRKFTTSSATKYWTVTASTDEQAPVGLLSLSQEMDGVMHYIAFSMSADGSFVLRPETDASVDHGILFYPLADAQRESAQYTSYPFGNGLPVTPVERASSYDMDCGTYILHIHNGQKTIQLR